MQQSKVILKLMWSAIMPVWVSPGLKSQDRFSRDKAQIFCLWSIEWAVFCLTCIPLFVVEVVYLKWMFRYWSYGRSLSSQQNRIRNKKRGIQTFSRIYWVLWEVHVNGVKQMGHVTTKPTKWPVRPGKTRPGWSESSLCAQWVAKDTRFLHEDSENSY